MRNGEHFQLTYLDASAAVKLLVEERGGRQVDEYMDRNLPLYMSSICVAETLGVLKRKWKAERELSEEEYFKACFVFLAHLAPNGKIIIENDDLADPQVFFECQDFASRYKLDLSDALQLFALKAGCMPDGILVTADSGLAKAARTEGLRVWNCEKEAAPDSPMVDSAT